MAPKAVSEKDSLNPAVAGATYGGGRGGGGDSGAGANPFSFGNSDAGAAQAGGELGFAGKVVNANGTGDPENYFSLIGRDESLFKKVNARYVQKSFSWIREDLGREGAARSLSGKATR